MNKDSNDLNFQLLQDEFNSVMTATFHNLERSWPNKYSDSNVNGGKFAISTIFRMSYTSYAGVIKLCELSEKEGLNLYLNAPSLNRSMVENLFTLIFLLDDFVQNNNLLIKNSIRERKELLDFYKAHYSGTPKWDEYLALEYVNFEKYQYKVGGLVKLTEEEKAKLENLPRFPRVSGVIKYLENKKYPDTKFLHFLDKVYYISLSHLAHLQPTGLIKIGKLFEDGVKDNIEEFINEQRWIAVTVIMSLISEIEIHFSFGLNSKISYLWGCLLSSSDYAEEAYSLRYQTLLTRKE